MSERQFRIAMGVLILILFLLTFYNFVQIEKLRIEIYELRLMDIRLRKFILEIVDILKRIV